MRLHNLVALAAVGNSGQLGLNNKLPWHDTDDLRRFRSLTMGTHCIVGRRTFESIAAFPGRHWHIYRGGDPYDFVARIVADNPPPTVRSDDDCKRTRLGEPLIYVIGGAYTYQQFLPMCRRVDLTLIDYNGKSDTTMPTIWRSLSNVMAE